MAYEKVFTPTYPDGWEDIPSHDTPVTAGVLDDYDEAIEHIENFLNGSSAVFPMQVTGGMTQPIGIDENGRLFTYPSGGGTAAETSYDNTESGLESTDVQRALDELASGAGGSTAATTTYDNTESRLEAENVQDAIDEVVDKISGGGGTVRVETPLINSEITWADNQTINLNHPVTDFDIIRVRTYYTHNTMKIWGCVDVWVNEIDLGNADNQFNVSNLSGQGSGIRFYFSSDGTQLLTNTGAVGGSGTWGEIIGIKEINSVSGMTKLWEYANSPAGMTTGTMELSDAYTNYDFLIFSSVRSNGSIQGNGIIPTDDLDISKTLSLPFTIPGADTAYGAITVTDTTHLAISSVSTDYGFRAIYGYKGGGSSRTETELISAPINLTTIGMTIALSDSIKNYDELILRCKPSTATSYNLETRFTLSDFVYGSTSDIYLTNEYHYDNGSGWFGFHPDSTGDNLIVDTANYCILQNVIGVKY